MEADWISHTVSPRYSVARVVPLPRFFLRLRQQRWTVFQSATVYATRGVYTRRWFYGNVNG